MNLELEHLALRLRHPGEGLVHLDPVGVVRDADAGARRLLGPASAHDANLLDAVHPADAAAASALLLGGAGTSRPVELRVRGAGGEWRTVEAVSSPTAGGTVVLLLDISDRRRRVLELERIAEELQRLAPGPEGLAPGAGRDALTGLLDRTAVFDVLTDRARAERATAILLVDVDGFADFCAEHGHGAGDVVLRTLGRRLVTASGAGHLVGRTGSDELAIVADDAGERGRLAAYGETLALVAAAPMAVRGQPVRISVSVGAAAGGAHFDPDGLVSAAGDALRRARALGGGRSVAVGPTVSG